MKYRLTILAALIVLPSTALSLEFATPSRNISCSINSSVGGEELFCIINERSGSPATPRAAMCGGDWGHVFLMTRRGAAEMRCLYGRPNTSAMPVVQYGSTINNSGFSCSSASTGLTCRNEVGSGFFLSRRQQTLTPPIVSRAVNPAPNPILEAGALEGQVRAIQHDLNALGYEAGPVDGQVGNRTRQAVLAFQRDRGEQATGTLTQTQYRELGLQAQEERGFVRPVRTVDNMDEIEPNQQTLELEQALSRLGFDPGPIDGLFSDEVVSALEAFRRSFGLPDGPLREAESQLIATLANAQPTESSSAAGEVGPSELSQITIAPLGRTEDAIALPSVVERGTPPVSNGAINGHFVPHQGRELFPDMVGAPLVVETTTGSIEKSIEEWTAWFRLNVPLSMPEILEIEVEDAVLFASLTLAGVEKRELEAYLALDDPLFMTPEQLEEVQAARSMRESYRRSESAIALNQRRAMESLDEFTRPGFVQSLNVTNRATIDRLTAQMPQPIVQLFSVEIGEYDFENQRFLVKAVRGGNNTDIVSPEGTILAHIAQSAYRGIAGARMNATVKEFPLFIPATPEDAQAILADIRQHRDDNHRLAFLRVYGSIDSLTHEPLHEGSDALRLVINTSVDRMSFSIDPDGEQVFHSETFQLDRIESLADAQAQGQDSLGVPYGLVHVARFVDDYYPDLVVNLTTRFWRDQERFQRIDPETYGFSPDAVPVGIRPDIIAGQRHITEYDWQNFEAFVSAQLAAIENTDEILIPFRTAITERQDGSVGPLLPSAFPIIGKSVIDLMEGWARSAPSDGQFPDFARTDTRVLSDNLVALAIAERNPQFSGFELFPAGVFSSPDVDENVGVVFAVRKGQFETDQVLALPGGFQTPSGQYRDTGSLTEPLASNELAGHIKLQIVQVHPPQNLTSAAAGRPWIVVEIEPVSMTINDRGIFHTIDIEAPAYGEPSSLSTLNDRLGPADEILNESASLDRAPVTIDSLIEELLVVRHLSHTLSQDDYRRLFLTRWYYEQQFQSSASEPRGGRYFEVGAPKPDLNTIDANLAEFTALITEQAAALPEHFWLMLGRPVREGFPNRVSERHVGGRQTPGLTANNCERNIRLAAERQEPWEVTSQAWTNGCEYLAQAADYSRREIVFGDARLLDVRNRQVQSLSPAGSVGLRSACHSERVADDDYCQSFLDALEDPLLAGKEFVLDSLWRFDRLPEATAIDLAHIQSLTSRTPPRMRLLVSLTAVTMETPLPPTPFDDARLAVDAYMADYGGGESSYVDQLLARQLVAGTVFEADVQRAVIVERETGEVVHTLENFKVFQEPDSSLLAPIDPPALELPQEPYGYDVLGVRLGMTFDEADALIREGMDVAQTLLLDQSNPALAGYLQRSPFNSIRVYLNADETEMVALFDKPPVAEGTVMALTRQLSVQPGQLSLPQIQGSLSEKYGDATRTSSDGFDWGNEDSRCGPGIDHLDGYWTAMDGTPVDWRTSRQDVQSSFLLPLNPQNLSLTRNSNHNCQPGVSVRLWTLRSSERSTLVQFLYDQDTFRIAAQLSLDALVSGAGASNVDIDF